MNSQMITNNQELNAPLYRQIPTPRTKVIYYAIYRDDGYLAESCHSFVSSPHIRLAFIRETADHPELMKALTICRDGWPMFTFTVVPLGRWGSVNLTREF